MKNYIGVGAIFVAITVVVLFAIMREEPPKEVQLEEDMQVFTQNIESQSATDIIVGHGLVTPRWKTVLASEVNGRLLEVSDSLLTGSLFKAGDLLVRVDPTAYEAALAGAKSTLATARRVYAEEKQRVEIATENWKHSGFTGKPTDLVLRKPQLNEAMTNIEYAKINVRKAEYDLAQTRIVAPYDGAVLERDIDPGSFVQTGSRVAKIYDRTLYEIKIPLNSSEIIRLPEQAVGGRVMISQRGTEKYWEGTIVRLDQAIDVKNRWRNVIVEVEGAPELLPGIFVTAEIQGRSYKHVLAVPEHYLGSNGHIWYVDRLELLQDFEAEILFRKDGKLYLNRPPTHSRSTAITEPRDVYLAGTRVKAVAEVEQTTLLDSATAGISQ